MTTFLKKRWIGPLVLLIYTALLCATLSLQFKAQLAVYVPFVSQEADHFLPITIQHGEIISPQNKFVHRSYKADDQVIHVVLDTRTDDLEVTAASEEGIYISKKCAHFVADGEIKRQCLEPSIPVEPWTLTTEGFVHFISSLGWYVFPLLLFSFMIAFYVVILFFTCIMHWLMAHFFRTSFGQTLFINTLAFVALRLCEKALPFNVGFILTLVCLILINICVCMAANQKKKDL